MSVDNSSTTTIPVVESTSIFAVGPSGTSAPDSITTASDGSLWIEYGNGASSQGAGGSSTIVHYNQQGQTLGTLSIANLVDGLKFNPTTKDVWALQNQDGNSTLTLIDPATGQVSAALPFADTTPTNGYDDVAFANGKVFVSRTNPAEGAPVVQSVDNGNSPFGTVKTTAILRLGDTGTNLVSGEKNQPLPLKDPDTLKTLADGTLVLTSDNDRTFTFIHNPGTSQQSETFITLPAGSSGLDDAVTTAGATSGTFTVANLGKNDIIQAKVTGLNPNDLYASVASSNAIVQIDPTTGTVTPVVTGLTSPHGLQFIASGSTTPTTDQAATAAPQDLGTLIASLLKELPSTLPQLALSTSATNTGATAFDPTPPSASQFLAALQNYPNSPLGGVFSSLSHTA